MAMTLTRPTRLAAARERLNARLFAAIHRRHLLYNQCWEDPALDRVALKLSPVDRVAVIASAGCNALDYLLAGAGQVHAVDVNPIQTALVELKAAGIRRLDYESFWQLFGTGRSPDVDEMYRDTLRGELTPPAQRFWDRHIVSLFGGRGFRDSFYYRGAAGLLARLTLSHLTHHRRLKSAIERLLAVRSLVEQRGIYESIRPKLWGRWTDWLLSRNATTALAGVPGPQRDQIESRYPGGIAQFIRDRVDGVFMRIPFATNYFWRVYAQGHYDRDCCPEYLTRAGFETLKAGAIDGLSIHTATLTEFLRRTAPGITRFVLLDHMDWMANLAGTPALRAEWEAILESAGPGARILYRSAGTSVDYLDPLEVSYRGSNHRMDELLRYDRGLAAELHALDRVHTYGSFGIADLTTD